MAGRMRPSLIPKLVLPGPGYYDGEYTVTKSKPPVYSMRGKFNVITDNNKPGPGAHCPEKVNLSHTPSYSFGIKHSPYLGRLKEREDDCDFGFSGIC
ncbi:hypothetical protein AWZ03_009275 [Drosophila navojoa]|uniref:Outer dense fiber protein 3 n=2 Tax=Drosophila navojoa TaxID=7232 RepID=A0A484B7N6_DRONA|nr:hypothetical protein AWZ03_009275 [Drosophila navojoa]